MAITALLELRLTPAALEQGAHDQLHAILKDTRAFEGCLGVEVLVDAEDPTHLVAVERWMSPEHDAAYRAWRAGDGQTDMASLLASPPVLTRLTTAEDV